MMLIVLTNVNAFVCMICSLFFSLVNKFDVEETIQNCNIKISHF